MTLETNFQIKNTKPLKILMIAPQPWFQPRGTPFSVLHRIKALSLLGHQVDLATYHIGQNVAVENLQVYRASRVPFINNIKIGPSVPKIFLDIALYRLVVSLLKNNKYDLIHTHEEAAFFGYRFALKHKIPHLYDMHSCLPQQLKNFKYTNSKLISGLFERLEGNTIKNSNAVITICPELQNYVNEQFPDKYSVLIENVADNSIVFPPNKEDKERLKKKYGIGNKKIVLYYGTFEAYQGIDMLIKSSQHVLERFPEALFLLVGGNEKQISEYSRMVNEVNMNHAFRFTGFVQPQDIPQFVDMADVLVSSRMRGNNSPLKIYSYLRSGKPIVATRHITHTQILNDNVSVLTEPAAKEFADGIVYVLQNPEKSMTLAKAAQQLAEEKYGYAEYLEKTQKIIEYIINTGL